MTGRAPTTSPFEELDHRESAGIEVSLLWNRTNDSLSVFVCDTRTVELFLLPTAPHEALDVFRHPFAYAARAA